MSDCASVDTPYDLGTPLLKSTEDNRLDQNDHKSYMSIVGSLMYIACHGAPEIQYAVNACASHMHSPSSIHLIAAKRIMRYLSGVLKEPNYIIYTYSPNDSFIKAFSDASWGGNGEDAKSTSGSLILFNGGPIAWQSKRQSTVALSSAEAEYMALTETLKLCMYVIMISNFMKIDLPLPFPILCDSQSAIQMARNPVSSQRTRHINIRYHYIREQVILGNINIVYLQTDEMLADIFTKPLGKIKFKEMVKYIYGK